MELTFYKQAGVSSGPRIWLKTYFKQEETIETMNARSSLIRALNVLSCCGSDRRLNGPDHGLILSWEFPSENASPEAESIWRFQDACDLLREFGAQEITDHEGLMNFDKDFA